jgi:hypothetical protein
MKCLMNTASRISWSTWHSKEHRVVPLGRSRRKSRRSAAILTRQPAWRPPPTTRAFCGPMCRSRSMCSPISWPIRHSILTSSRAKRTSSRRRSGPARTRRTILFSITCSRPHFQINRWGALFWERARRSARSTANACGLISHAIIARPTWSSPQPVRLITRTCGGRGATALCHLYRSGGAGAGTCAF